MESNIKKTNLLISLAILIFCAGVSIIILYDYGRPYYYQFLWVLPLLFGITVLISSVVSYYSWSNLYYILTCAIFGIRNVFTPLIMKLGHYMGYLQISSQDSVNKGLALMAYDSFVILMYVALKTKNEIEFNSAEYADISASGKEDIFMVICAGVFLAFAVLRRDFYSGFTTIFSSTTIRTIEAAETATGALYTLFSVFFPIGYLYLCLYFMCFVNRRFSNRAIKQILNILLICVPFLFMNNSDGFTLICMICLAFASMKMNGISKKIFIISVGGLASFIIIYLLLMVSSMSFNSSELSAAENLSKALQAYFPGVCNFAGVFNMQSHDKLNSLFYDIYYTIPFRNSIFGVPGDGRLVVYYTADNRAYSQIIPCGGQFFYYFGILGPFIECFFYKYASKMINNSLYEKNIYMYFCYIMGFVYLVLTPVMYNFTICMARLLATIIPFMIFAKIFDKSTVQDID